MQLIINGNKTFNELCTNNIGFPPATLELIKLIYRSQVIFHNENDDETI